ncbi:MAG TPA: hypothetical protein VFX70_11645 [Mycobacteriales bacterium]|nr:hypothetical protein [Mycobacteriales bacterium]
MRHYWLDQQDAPFATLCVVGTYRHSEAGPDAYGDLIRLVRTRPDDVQVRRITGDLRPVHRR